MNPQENIITGRALDYGSVAFGSGRTPTRFAPSAFPDAMQVPLLWDHDTSRPLGVAKVVKDERGLHATARIADTSTGRDALALIKTGGMRGLSIGFSVQTSKRDADAIRVVTGASLDELSLVVFPADRAALLQTVNGEALPEFHAAPPLETETMQHGTDVMAEVRAAEAEVRALYGDAEPARQRGRFCIFRNRELTAAEVHAQERGQRLLDEYERNGASSWMHAIRCARPRR